MSGGFLGGSVSVLVLFNIYTNILEHGVNSTLMTFAIDTNLGRVEERITQMDLDRSET